MRRQAIAIFVGALLVTNICASSAHADDHLSRRPAPLKKINIFKKAALLPGEIARFPLRVKRVWLESKERGGLRQILKDRGLREGLKMGRTGFELTSLDHEKRTAATFLDHVGQAAGPRSAGVALSKRSTDKSRHWFYGSVLGAKLTGLLAWRTIALYQNHAETATSQYFASVPNYTIPVAVGTLAALAATLGVRHVSKRYARRAKQREMIGIAHELAQEGKLADVLTQGVQGAARSNKVMDQLRKIAGTKNVEAPTTKQIVEGLLTAITDERQVATKMGRNLIPRSYTNSKGAKKFGRQFNPDKIINVELYAGKAKDYIAKLDKLEQAVLQIHSAPAAADGASN